MYNQIPINLSSKIWKSKANFKKKLPVKLQTEWVKKVKNKVLISNEAENFLSSFLSDNIILVPVN